MYSSYKVWLMVVVMGMVGAGQARADLISTTPYTLAISESQAVLADPGNQRVADLAAMTTGHELGIERSEPYFLLTNTSDSTLNGSILNFQFTIGDTADQFRFVELISSASSAGVQLVSSSLGTNNQELDLAFSGLASGASVEFRVGLEPVNPDANPLVNYGHVFFNNGSDGASNSVTTVTFDNPAINSTLTPLTLSDQAAVAAASAATTTATCNCGSLVSGVTSFDFQPTVIPTPEPSSMVLLGLGLVGLVSVAWRKRRSAQRRLV